MPKQKVRPQRPVKPIFHIFCEGEKTEPNYLNGYIRKRFPGTRLIIVEKTDKNTPREIVGAALDAQARAESWDVFWAVYDREGKTKYSDELHAQAKKDAGSKIQIALSNVCFEVWLLLHFQDSAAAYDCCKDLLKRSDLKNKHIKDYDKSHNREYSDGEISRARQNAARMNRRTKDCANPEWTQPHQWNPYTDVHKLLDAIDKFGKKNCSRSP